MPPMKEKIKNLFRFIGVIGEKRRIIFRNGLSVIPAIGAAKI